MADISLFPIFSQDGDIDLFKLSDPAFSYHRNGNDYELTIEQESRDVYSLKDSNKYWTIENYGFCYSQSIQVSEPEKMFGSEGYACKNATIGIGLIWNSKTSNLRGSSHIGSFRLGSKSEIFEVNEIFERASLRGEVIIRIVLYIEKSGKPTKEEMMLANNAGMIIGELSNITLLLDGNGSMFPIYNVEIKGDTLWNVHITYEDPSIDLFEECVCINLNTKNPGFKYIDRDSDDFNNQMLIEVLSSALSLIIENLRAFDNNFSFLQNAQEGSIAQAVQFFKDKLSWDLSTPENLSHSIRKYLEAKLVKS